MVSRTIRLSAIGAFVSAATLLTGCTGGSSVPPAPPEALTPVGISIALPSIVQTLRAGQPLAAGPIEPDGTAPFKFGNDAQLYGKDLKLVNTAQLYGKDLGVYQRAKNHLGIKFVESLRRGLLAPQGTVATPDGWWYVANGGHANVLVYRVRGHGPKGPFAGLDDYGQIPVNVDVTANRKLVAVANVSGSSGGPGSVSVYLNRRAEPARMLTYGTHVRGIGVAIDGDGNCYWSFNNRHTNNGSIVRFAGCNGSGAVVIPTIGYAGGLTFDRHGNLYYVDQTAGIYKCAGTSNCVLLATGFGDPVNINFDRGERHLWVADATGFIDAVNPNSGAIEYSKPAAGGSADPPFGIAPVPGD